MNTRFQSNCLILTDLFSLYLSFALGFIVLVPYAGLTSEHEFQVWFATTGISHLLTFSIFAVFAIGRLMSIGLYQKRLLFWDELPLIFETIFIFAVLHGVTVFVFHSPLSRTLWLSSWIFAPWVVIFGRGLVKKLLRRCRQWDIRAVCIGDDALSKQFYHLTLVEPLLGIQVVRSIGVPENIDFLDFHQNLRATLKAEPRYDLICVATQNPLALRLFQTLSNDFPNVHLVPPLQGVSLLGLQTQYFFSHEVFLLSPKAGWIQKSEERLKRAFDVFGSLVFLITLSPVILTLAILIWMSEPGSPIFFRQRRHGFRGELFECFKFRTMVKDAEKKLQAVLDSDPIARREWTEKTKISKDPRVTPVGNFLRKTSLDELPQLWNVLRGDMSLVGPRPILLHEDEKYGKDFSIYQKFRPGLTGLWQVSGRSDTSFEFRIFLDTWYVRNWSPWYDLAILFKTIGVIFNRKGAY